MALLFVDLLGVKSQWATGGRAAAQARFAAFEQLILSTVARPGVTAPRLGSVESDAAAFDFSSTNDAIRFGANLYQEAFSRARRPADPRFWLRGALVAAADGASVRTNAPLSPTAAYIQKYSYSDPLLDAISIEKCGFRGMRLVIDDVLLTTSTRNAFAQTLPNGVVKPFRRLNYSAYPTQVGTGYSDILWMLVDSAGSWTASNLQMNKLLRWASSDGEEFQQAAATQLLFNETSAIMASLT